MEAGPRIFQRKYLPAMEAGWRMPQRKYIPAMEAGPRMPQRKYLPAMEAGPRMPQRKYMQRMIWSGELQIMLMKRTRSMNFWVSTAIRLVVSPTEEKRSCIPDNILPVDT
jgi:hypothetical protein